MQVPVGGGFDTPQAASFSVGEGMQYNVTGLSVNRYLHDPSDGWVHSRWISPLGASGHPGSAHYADQVPYTLPLDVLDTFACLHGHISRDLRRANVQRCGAFGMRQAQRWSDLETIPQLWEWSDVLTAMETTQTLHPAGAKL